MICIVMSPVGPYFPTGLQPISLFIDEQNVRAWPGGVGANKVGTNYAPTIGPQTDAAAEYGTSQVIYSFPQGSNPEDALVSECGSMNMMFFIQKVSFALHCFVCLRQAAKKGSLALNSKAACRKAVHVRIMHDEGNRKVRASQGQPSEANMLC